MIRSRDGVLTIDVVPWGWEPFWAKGKRPLSINARSETVASSRFFKSLWPQGRVLVPANLWFEWVKDPADIKKKQPYAIRLKSQRPMFFAGLAQIHSSSEATEGDGMVIITDASDEGMVDIHDRRPVVLDPEQARAWIADELRSEGAEMIAREFGRPVSDFEWFKVDRAVGNVRNQGADLIVPVTE